MKKQLLDTFLMGFKMLSQELRSCIAEDLVVREFHKGATLLREGAVPAHCYFVLKGCVRQFQIVEGVEKTTAFFTEDQGAVSSDCYVNRTRSHYYLECVEDCILMVGDHDTDARLFAKYPVLQDVIVQVMHKEWLKTQNELAAFKIATPEKRYLNLLEHRADLLNRAPNHQIASYLGITPESLSRIRKRIASRG